MQQQLHEEDWERTLQQGNLFIKHHKYSSEKLRQIWVTTDMSEICWAEAANSGVNKDQKQKAKGSVKTVDVTEVKHGLQTSRKMTEENQFRDENVLTIITEKRTLEIESPTKVLKQEWVELLFKLFKSQGNNNIIFLGQKIGQQVGQAQ